MAEPHSYLALATVAVKLLASPEVGKLVKSKLITREQEPNELLPSASKTLSENRLPIARKILGQARNLSSPELHELAIIVNAVEIYLDWTKYAFKHDTSQGIYWNHINENLDKLRSDLRNLTNQLTLGNSSTRDNTSGMSNISNNEGPDYHEVRTCLLFLSLFPDCCVFNRSRVTRLLVIIAHIVFRNGRHGPTLKQLARTRRLKEVGSSNAPQGPQHFLIGDDLGTRSKTWPELAGFCKDPEYEDLARFIVVDASDASDAIEGQKTIEKIPHKIKLCSLIYLGTHALDLAKIRYFKLLRILSLRNVNLTNEKYLKSLCLLKHLDLKYSNVRGSDWLEGLEELEMLDLRHTYVEEIPDKCLEKLGKLQFLLLGYVPRVNTWLTGAKLDIRKLDGRKNLKILRKIKWSTWITDLRKVSDLSVTDLKTENEIQGLWRAVERLIHLTSLGVAAAHTVDLLQYCQQNAKGRLERLCLEGKFIPNVPGSIPPRPNYRVLDNLKHFQKLTDLTLAPSRPIDVNKIPPLGTLLCLRLYCVSRGPTMTFEGKEFEKLKKLVIGNMEEVKNIEISKAMVEGLDTLKLCDLPKFEGLLSFEFKVPFLRIGKSRGGGFEPIHSQKTVFLKGEGFPIHKIRVDKSPKIAIYIYEMNKQCYEKRG